MRNREVGPSITYTWFGAQVPVTLCYRRYNSSSDITEDGLELEFASQGSVTNHLSKHPTLSCDIRLKWCVQAAEALAFVHSKGVIHCNFHTDKLSLDAELNALLSDNQGTIKKATMVTLRKVPDTFSSVGPTSLPSEATDGFAFGSLIYTIMVGIDPYSQLSDAKVEERYRRTNSLILVLAIVER